MKIEREVPDDSVVGILYLAPKLWREDPNWQMFLDAELLALRKDLIMTVQGRREISELTNESQ